MIALDTNLLARLMLHDDAAQFKKVKALFQTRQIFTAPVTVMLELVWVLLHFTRMMTILKRAANRPIGYVDSAVMLNAKLKTWHDAAACRGNDAGARRAAVSQRRAARDFSLDRWR